MDYLSIAAVLVLVTLTALHSLLKSNGLEREMLYSSGRAIIQLIILGFVLTWIFAHNTAVIAIVAALFMTLNAGIHSRSRVKTRYPGMFLDHLISTVLSIWPLVFIGTQLFRSTPWWSVEQFLPLMGMLLGNTLNGISVGVENYTHVIQEKREEILGHLALGASTDEATKSLFNRSLKLALTPIMNSMLSMGIVSIPGTMTGQILGGSSPLEASQTQLIIALLIIVGCYLGTVMGLNFARKRLFNGRGQPCF